LILRQALFAFVPWATTTFAAIEGLAFRPNQPVATITPFAFPSVSLLLVALAAEAALSWSQRRASVVLPVVAVTAVRAAYLERPWDQLVPRWVRRMSDPGSRPG
jgi:Mn2+/Fe2+ NRAMP family transporter